MYAFTTNADGSTSWRAIASEADVRAGEIFAIEPPSPTLADAAAVLSAAVQAWLDATAQANGYDSLFTCISYLNSSVQQYADDAAAALAWRDAVWPACFQWQRAALATPPAVFPTVQEVITQLPQPGVFGWTAHTPGASV